VYVRQEQNARIKAGGKPFFSKRDAFLKKWNSFGENRESFAKMELLGQVSRNTAAQAKVFRQPLQDCALPPIY
jgi:hypothetical protein